MFKLQPARLIVAFLFLFSLAPCAHGVDAALAKDSTLEGILNRGELRIGIEVGYMPFEMIDKRAGLRRKGIRQGNLR